MGGPVRCSGSLLLPVLLSQHSAPSVMPLAKGEKMSKSSSGSSKTGSTRLAELIRDRRHRLGPTPQQLAEATGAPSSIVGPIENAYPGRSPHRLGVIARALQLAPAELYDVLASEPTAAT